ncbi:hypothetical protein D3C85_1051360 [compost metagenome]
MWHDNQRQIGSSTSRRVGQIAHEIEAVLRLVAHDLDFRDFGINQVGIGAPDERYPLGLAIIEIVGARLACTLDVEDDGLHVVAIADQG